MSIGVWASPPEARRVLISLTVLAANARQRVKNLAMAPQAVEAPQPQRNLTPPGSSAAALATQLAGDEFQAVLMPSLQRAAIRTKLPPQNAPAR